MSAAQNHRVGDRCSRPLGKVPALLNVVKEGFQLLRLDVECQAFRVHQNPVAILRILTSVDQVGSAATGGKLVQTLPH